MKTKNIDNTQQVKQHLWEEDKINISDHRSSEQILEVILKTITAQNIQRTVVIWNCLQCPVKRCNGLLQGCTAICWKSVWAWKDKSASRAGIWGYISLSLNRRWSIKQSLSSQWCLQFWADHIMSKNKLSKIHKSLALKINIIGEGSKCRCSFNHRHLWH